MRPEMKEYVNQYVRAVYDFETNHPREVNLQKGDIIKVTSVVDSNWLCGQLRDHEGNFPASFVEKLPLPAVQDNQKIFGAIENFPALQPGDLEFRKGAVIIGLHPVDQNWWTGQLGSKKGIFPLTHVIELEVPSKLRERSKSCHSSEPLFAQALCDSVAQLDEELSFKTGDLITVTEVIDSDWYFGELGGKKGMFLSSCVQLIQDDSQNEDSSSHNSTSKWKSEGSGVDHLQKSYSFDQSYYGRVNDSVNTSLPECHTSQSSTQGAGHHGDSPQDNVCDNVTSYHGNMASNHGYQASENLDSTAMDNAAYTSENTKSGESSVNPYAVAQYPFAGQSDDELTFGANEIIYLIQHIDEQWTEGEIDGKIGLFPTSFVSVIVDCPYAYTKSSEVSDEDSLKPREENAGKLEIKGNTSENSESYALVLYSFPAELEGDLQLEQGETVVVIENIDDNWVRARKDSGQCGLCPRQFVEIIGDSLSDLKPSSDQTMRDVSSRGSESKAEEINEDRQEVISSESHVSKSELSQQVDNKKVDSLPSKTVKIKPQLGPKPALKPKPMLLPKPGSGLSGPVKTNKVDFNENRLSVQSSMQKSMSALSLEEPKAKKENQRMKKSASSIEFSDKNIQKEGSAPGENENVNKTDLDDMIVTEMIKARADSKDQTQEQDEFTSNKDANKRNMENMPIIHRNNRILKDEDPHKRHSVSFPVMAEKSSKSESDMTKRTSVRSQYSVGQSTFFVEPGIEGDTTKKILPMRKPPPIPQRSFEIDQLFDRKPSLRKPPPPRPTGPRIAPAPSKEPLVPEKVATSERRVPQRPAPARPDGSVLVARPTPSQPEGGAQPTRSTPARPQDVMRPPKRPPPRVPIVKEPGADLMRFSPSRDDAEEASEEVIADLRRRIQETEMDLESCRKSRDELQTQLSEEGEETGEIKDNIVFYDANIEGLTEELGKLKDNLHKVCPEERSIQAKKREEEERRAEEEKKKEEERKMSAEMKAKRKEKREKVTEELIQTEKDFLQGLSLCMEVFISPEAEKHPEVDLDLLLGNMEDIADVSQRLLADLEAATQGKEFEQQVIGACFAKLADDMKNAYAPYCRNHDSVITLLEKYKENPSVSAFLHSQLDKLRERCVVFDLEAILIKPVQRILKYPLLLNELFKSTEDDHPDKMKILAAINAMTDVATAINEYKRRKDLVYKYKKDTDISFGDKLAKLSLHTLRKKGSRFRGRISGNLGFSQTRDENFDIEESRFRQLEKIVKIFVRDAQTFMTQLQDSVSCHENLVADVIDFYDDKQQSPTVQQFHLAQQMIDQKFLPEFLENVTVLVVSPLNKLTQMFEAPNKVIQKRYDKLLDYDNLLKKGKDEKATEKALNKAKADYEALNAQLLDELPKLYNLSLQLLQDCIATFVRSQQEYANKLFLHMSDMLDLPSLLSPGENIVETFNIQHVAMVDRLSLLSFIPKGFNPKMDAAVKSGDKKANKRQSIVATDTASPQMDSQKVYLRQQYGSDRLYRVVQTYTAQDMMDITLQEGDLVGVVMNKDPMGNKERWFVDNGASKGFVPSHILQLHQPSPQPTQSSQLYPTISQPDSLSPSSIGHSPQSSDVTRSSIGQNLENSSSQPSAQLSASPIGQIQTSPRISIQSMPEEEVSDELDEMLNEDMTPDVSNDYSHDSYVPECEEFYYAEYPFSSRTGNEVSLFEGQVVTVLAKHDEEQNTEWWYVDADGHRGYAPSAYLRPMS